MFCISVSFKKTPLSIRERFAFSKEEQLRFLECLRTAGGITGGVVLSTCNRSEIYITGNRNATESLETVLSCQKGIDKEQIKNFCLYYSGVKAVRHLFQVACGLDSMVLGEDEILRQVKEAYQNASGCGFVNGELNVIFQGAFHCAKVSKSATRLSSTPVSIGTLTANAIAEYLEEKQKTEKISRTVLVIGATGKIGSIVSKDLLSKGITVLGTQRKKHQGEEIFSSSREKLQFVDFHERYRYISQVDAVVSATASPHYTLTKGEYQKWCQGKGQLFIDLAVPCDIDKDIGAVTGNVLYDIDYFEELSRKNNAIKRGELGRAEEILETCVEEVMKNLYVRDFQKAFGNCKTEEWFPKMIYYLKDILDSDAFLQVLQRIEDKSGGRK